MQANNRKSILILSFTLVVVMLGYGIVLPILPFYVEQMGASGQEMGLLTSISAFTQLIFAPLWGSLSDRIGRKPVLLIGVLGYGITMLLFGLSTRIWMLFAARALNGMISSATMPTSMAYISDHTSEKQRGAGMGQLGAAMGAGVVLGPGLGGVLAKFSLSTPFFVASGLCLVALLLVWAFLPESRPAQPAAPGQPRDRLNLATVRAALNGPVGVLMLLILVVSFGMSGLQGILGLYALHRFGLDPGKVGGLWIVIGALMIVSQGMLTGLLTRRFGELRVIRLSLLATALGFGLMLLAGSYLTLLLATGFLILAIALLGPALNSLLSARATLKQGITMGLNNSFSSLGRIVGPLWAGWIFDINAGLPFLSSAVILTAGFLVSLLAVSRPAEKAGEQSQVPVA